MPKAAATGERSYYWVGTWNHMGEEREAQLPDNAELLKNHPWFKKIYASEERGTINGTLHIQLYVECIKRKRRSEMHEEFPEVHWQPRRGNSKQARDYALGLERGMPKEGWIRVLIDKGEHEDVGQGKRTDIESMRDLLLSTEVTTVKDAMDKCTSMASLSYAKEWIACHAPAPREHPPKVFWFYGSTGTGKTRAVYDFSREAELDLWRMPASGTFFQGYIGQPVALFDDFREGRLPFTELLELTDRYTPVANVKYGQCWFTPNWIVFTSAKSIRDTFTGTTEDVGQLLRRINEGGGCELDFDGDGLVQFKQRIDVFLEQHNDE